MPAFLADAEKSALVVVDLQPSFLKAIAEAERVLSRSSFLVQIARLLDVPIIVTEQNPERMGGTHPDIAAHLASAPIAKMTFACAGCPDFDAVLASNGRKQAELVGIETHICVAQTAIRLLGRGYEVAVCEDAVGARSDSRHESALRRLRHAGVDVTQTESVAYEWLGSASHPKFREAIEIVKSLSD